MKSSILFSILVCFLVTAGATELNSISSTADLHKTSNLYAKHKKHKKHKKPKNVTEQTLQDELVA